MEIEKSPKTKEWHDGWKTYTGITVITVTVLAGMFGYDVREAFPVEIARFGEEAIILLGAILAFYGRWKTKGNEWFEKKKK